MRAVSRDPLAGFRPAVRDWFRASFAEPTLAQRKGWPPILAGIDRLMFSPEPPKKERCRILYVSPLKALAVDVERNLRAPIAGVAATAERAGRAYRMPAVAIRSGDTPAK